MYDVQFLPGKTSTNPHLLILEILSKESNHKEADNQHHYKQTQHCYPPLPTTTKIKKQKTHPLYFFLVQSTGRLQ